MLSDYLISEIQSAGNEEIKPWSLIAVGDADGRTFGGGPQTDRSDFLVLGRPYGLPGEFLNVEPDSPVDLNNPTLPNDITVTFNSTTYDDNCPDDYNSGHALIYRTDTNASYPVFIDSVTNESGGGEIKCRFGLQKSNGHLPEVGDLSALFSDWDQIQIQAVDIDVYYLKRDDDDHLYQLWSFRDTNNDGLPNDIEINVMAHGVYDLQFALGYDFNPADQKVRDYRRTDDEWLFNSVQSNGCTAATEQTDLMEPDYLLPQGASPTTLRMIAAGVTLGTRMMGTQGNHISEKIQLFNGDCLQMARTHLRGLYSRAMLRSISVFR